MQVLTCFVDESGSPSDPSNPLFAVGLLVVRNVDQLTDRLHTVSLNLNARTRERRLALQRDVREFRNGALTLEEMQMLLAKTRHHEYKFTGVTSHNVLDYMAILGEFFSIGGAEFHAILVDRSVNLRNLYGPAAWVAYVMLTKTLVRRRIREPAFICCDWQARPKDQVLSLERELTSLPHVAGCLRLMSDTSCFLQITDLLVGAVSFDWRDSQGLITPSTNSALKRDIARFVKSKLRLRQDQHFVDTERPYFARRAPIPFSVWQPSASMLEPPPKKQRARGMHRGQSRSTG